MDEMAIFKSVPDSPAPLPRRFAPFTPLFWGATVLELAADTAELNRNRRY